MTERVVASSSRGAPVNSNPATDAGGPWVQTNVLRPLRASAVARWQRRKRQLADERQKGAWRLVGLIAMGLGVAVVVAAIATAAGLYVRFRGAEILASLMTSGALLGIMSALLLSSLGHAVQAFFAAKDLWFWNASPAASVALFVDRCIETMIASLPAVGSLGAIALGAFVIATGLGPWTLLRAELALAAVALLPVLLGVAAAHAGAALLPAGKLRQVSLLILTVASAGFLLWVRAIRIEKVVTEKGAQELLQSAEGLSHVGPWWLPSSLGASFAVEGSWGAGAMLVAMVTAGALVAFGCHRFLYATARDRASDTAPKGLVPTSRRRRLLVAMARVFSTPRTHSVVERDLLVFFRDPAQWSQLILLLGIGLVYLINANALVEGFGGFGAASDVVLGTLHTGLVCFISAGLAARFGFSAVAAEGPAFWVVEGAPLSPRAFVDGKWRGSLLVIAGYPMLVGAAGGFALGLPLLSWMLSMTLVVVTSVSLAAFSVGRGARAPAFNATNLSELAMGPGALSTMALAVMASGAMAVGFATITGGRIALETFTTLGPMAALIFALGLPLLGGMWWAGQTALTRGAEALSARRVNPRSTS